MARANTPATSPFVGNIDAAAAGVIFGWALERRDPNARLQVEARVDGVPMRATTGVPRPDVSAVHAGVNTGFQIVYDLPAPPAGNKSTVSIELLVVDVETSYRLARIQVPAAIWSRPTLGSIEAVTRDQVWGWLLDRRTNTGSAQGYLAIGDHIRIPLTSSIDRMDLAALHPKGLEGPTSGFAAELPLSVQASVKMSSIADMSLFAIGSKEPVAKFPLSEAKLASTLPEASRPFSTAVELLRHTRHDANPEYAMLRDPSSAFSTSVKARSQLDTSGSKESAGSYQNLAKTHGLSIHGQPVSDLVYWLVERGMISQTRLLNIRAQGLPGDVADALLTLESIARELTGSSPLHLIDAPNEGVVFNDAPGFPGPPLTMLQFAYWRTSCPEVDVFTELGLSTFFATWLTLLRDIRGGANFVTPEQTSWLHQRPGDLWGVPSTTNRYMIGRRAIVSRWQHFADSDADLLGLACDCVVDEIRNGYGWTFIGDELRSLLTKSSGDGAPAAGGILTRMVWLSSRLPQDESISGQSDHQFTRWTAFGDFDVWLGELPPSHPLYSGPEPCPHPSAPAVRDTADDAGAAQVEDVTVVGLVGHQSGVGFNADQSLTALARNDVSTTVLPLDFSHRAVGFELTEIESLSSQIIFHVQPDYMPGVMAHGAHLWSQAGRTIGFYAWEFEQVPRLLHPALRAVDEVWTPSRFCADAFRGHTPAPVHVVPHAVEIDHTALTSRSAVRAGLGISESTFMVHMSFDAHSLISRKNPIAGIRAFHQAFGPREDVALLVKVRNFDALEQGAARGDWRAAEFLREIHRMHNCRLVSSESTRHMTLSYISAADCYLSLHRSEGFGYAMAEAMALSTPVVATDYSGNLEFMNHSNSWLVPATLVSVLPEEYLYWDPGMRWADPEVSAAADMLRQVADGGQEVGQRRALAEESIRMDFSMAAMAKRYAELLRNRS